MLDLPPFDRPNRSRSKEEVPVTVEQVVVWVIIGGLAGLLADAFVKGIRLGLAGAIVVGMLGGLIGGWLFGLLGVSVGGGLLGDILVAFVGAVVLLLILRVLRRG